MLDGALLERKSIYALKALYSAQAFAARVRRCVHYLVAHHL